MRLNLTATLLATSILGVLVIATPNSARAQQAPAPHVFFRVQLATAVPGPLSGRLLIFLKQGKGDKEVNIQEFHPGETWVAAEVVHDLMPGTPVEIDADQIAYPKPFSALPAGDYEVQAVLDTDHTYNYSGRTPEDWISPVLALTHWNPSST
ncbi:MAG: enterochelin esterase, partial [Acidobacteriaceae bacterium]